MLIFRSTLWFLVGLKDYTKSGYQRAASKFNPKALDVSLAGKVAIVTGANSGLGKTTALELARRGTARHF